MEQFKGSKEFLNTLFQSLLFFFFWGGGVTITSKLASNLSSGHPPASVS